MSAFIVEPKTINRILSYLYLERDNEWLSETIGYDIKNENNLDQLGREMLMLNIQAVNYRYDEENNSTALLEEYRYKLTLNVNNIQALKSLQCWSYQCSEGNIPEESELYKLMEKVKVAWLSSIVSKLPTYDKAEWA